MMIYIISLSSSFKLLARIQREQECLLVYYTFTIFIRPPRDRSEAATNIAGRGCDERDSFAFAITQFMKLACRKTHMDAAAK